MYKKKKIAKPFNEFTAHLKCKNENKVLQFSARNNPYFNSTKINPFVFCLHYDAAHKHRNLQVAFEQHSHRQKAIYSKKTHINIIERINISRKRLYLKKFMLKMKKWFGANEYEHSEYKKRENLPQTKFF